jgi:hypothetical protein
MWPADEGGSHGDSGQTTQDWALTLQGNRDGKHELSHNSLQLGLLQPEPRRPAGPQVPPPHRAGAVPHENSSVQHTGMSEQSSNTLRAFHGPADMCDISNHRTINI